MASTSVRFRRLPSQRRSGGSTTACRRILPPTNPRAAAPTSPPAARRGRDTFRRRRKVKQAEAAGEHRGGYRQREIRRELPLLAGRAEHQEVAAVRQDGSRAEPGEGPLRRARLPAIPPEIQDGQADGDERVGADCPRAARWIADLDAVEVPGHAECCQRRDEIRRPAGHPRPRGSPVGPQTAYVTTGPAGVDEQGRLRSRVSRDGTLRSGFAQCFLSSLTSRPR